MSANKSTQRVLLGILSLACVLEEAAWGDVHFYRLGKRIAYEQSDDNQPTVHVSMDGGVDMFTDNSNDFLAARVFSTKPSVLSLASPFSLFEFSPGYWGSSGLYSSVEEMDIDLPPGDTFGYLIEGGDLSSRLALLPIPEQNLFPPEIPYFTNGAHSQLNGLETSNPLTITWNGYSIPVGVTDAPIFFNISRISDGQSVASTVVSNNVTSFNLAANTLAPATAYRADLGYSARVVDIDVGFFMADAAVSYDLATTLYFTTGGAEVRAIPEPMSIALIAGAISLFCSLSRSRGVQLFLMVVSLSLVFEALPSHATVSFYRLGRTIAYTQTSDSSPTTPTSIYGGVDMFADDPADLIAARVFSTQAAPTVPEFPLTEFSPGYWGISKVYSSIEEMDLELLPGDTLGFLIEGGNLGSQLALLEVPGTNLFSPELPYFTNNGFSQLNGMNPSAGYTITWNGYTPLPEVTSSPIFFGVYRVSDGQFMTGTVVSNTVTSFLIPAGTLAHNTQYRANLDYSSRLDVFDAGFSVGDSSALYDVVTDLAFTTGSESPGDFDFDGDVDGRDFLIWQRGESTNGPLDAGDLADWQANYGETPDLSSITVPEPSGMLVMAFGMAVVALRPRVLPSRNSPRPHTCSVRKGERVSFNYERDRNT